ncbi:MAG: hypothetical protein U1D30_01840 [Planctomycetota bacterium]
MFHANLGPCLDPATGALIENNPCPDEKTLRQLCDPEFVFETFGQDEVVHLLVASRTGQVANEAILESVARNRGRHAAGLEHRTGGARPRTDFCMPTA